MEEDAIYMGLDLNYFWSLNVKQYSKHVRAFNKRQNDKMKEKDALNHILGKYIAFAVNEPKKYPKNPFSMQEKKQINVMTEEELEKQAKRNTALLGGVIR